MPTKCPSGQSVHRIPAFFLLRLPLAQLGENIQVLLLPLKGLSGELTRLKQQNNWAIDSRLLAFALGLDFAAESSLTATTAAATASAN